MADSDLPALVTRAQQGDRAAFDEIVQHTARLVYAQIVASVRDRHKAEDLAQETFLAAWKGIGSVQAGANNAHGTVSWLLTLARNKVLDALKFEARLKRGGTAVGGTGATATIPVGAMPAGGGAVAGRSLVGDRGGEMADESHTSAKPMRGSAPLGQPTRASAPLDKPTRASAPLSAPLAAPLREAEVADRRPAPDQAAQYAEARDHALRLLNELPEEYRRPLAMRYLAGADYETIRRALGLSDGALRGVLTRGMALLREQMTRLDDDEVRR